MLAVGIGANSKLLRIPTTDMRYLRAYQSKPQILGVYPQRSNCKSPWEVGEP